MVLLVPLPRDAAITPLLTIVKEATVAAANATTPQTIESANATSTITAFASLTTATLGSPTQPFPSLITIFTPPPSCLANVYDIAGTASLLTVAPVELPECYPSSMYTIFSPGLCPSDYFIVAHSINTTFIVTDPENISTVTTTECACCPSSFSYVNNACLLTLANPNEAPIETTLSLGGVVTGSLTTTSSITLVDIDPIVSYQSDGGTSTEGSSTTTATTALSTQGIISITAPVFQVRFQETDTAVSSSWDTIISQREAEIAEQNSQLSSYKASLSQGSAVPSVSTSPHTSGSSISGGAIAGIVIGAIAGLLLVIGAVFWWLRRRKNQTLQSTQDDTAQGEGSWVKPELDSKPVGHAELDDSHEVKEVWAPPVELPGDAVEPTEMRVSPITPQTAREVN